MSHKDKKRLTGFVNLQCNKCGAKGHSRPDSQHRNCSGDPNSPIREASSRLPGNQRGMWLPVSE